MQILRYGLVGIFSNAAGYLVYLALTHYGLSPKISMSVLYCSVALASFIGNRKFTFFDNRKLFGPGLRFISAYFVGYCLNLTILIICVDQLGYPHYIVQACAVLSVAVYLFLSLKFFVFKSNH
jgi:putative flippase GtrA